MTVSRPRQIVQAIALLWVSTSLGIASGYLEAQRDPDPWAATAVMLLTMLGVLGVLSVMLWRGRNWARLTYLILVAMSLASLIASWGVAERPPLEVALEAVSFVADAGSFFLMFTQPGASWFESAAEQGDRA
jgi:predicted membrane channel-forming protein YqfA (hemolysin III family)